MFENEDRSLDVAAWHLQMLLTSVGSFDGKIMFLTALNVAGMSALIGIVIAADPSIALLAVGFVLLSLCTALGLGVLWSANLQQFPSPEEIEMVSQTARNEPSGLILKHLASIQEATWSATDALRRRILITRALLLSTPIGLALVVATAVSSAI